ncbi:MAG: hypothetical protein IJU43_00925 [Lachnospiraceae bacterium]|nr:hypothetical protein [Lachnospiraceae bacterium]
MNSNLSCSAILLTVIISFMLLSVSALADTPDGGADNAVAGAEDTQTETNAETEGGSASVSENKIEITCEKSSMEDRRVQIMVRACAKNHSIDLIQVENTGSGIRKTLFLASPDDEKKESAEAGFAATANGIYSFYAYDEDGRYEKTDVPVTEIDPADISCYIEKVGQNRSRTEREESSIPEEPRYGCSQILLLGGERAMAAGGTSGEHYSVRTHDTTDPSDPVTGVSKYADWDLLKMRKSPEDIKAWYEPLVEAAPQTLDNTVTLSDYEVGLFRTDMTSSESPASASSGMDPERDIVFEFGKVSKEDDGASNRKPLKKVLVFVAFILVGITAPAAAIAIKKKRAQSSSSSSSEDLPYSMSSSSCVISRGASSAAGAGADEAAAGSSVWAGAVSPSDNAFSRASSAN